MALFRSRHKIEAAHDHAVSAVIGVGGRLPLFWYAFLAFSVHVSNHDVRFSTYTHQTGSGVDLATWRAKGLAAVAQTTADTICLPVAQKVTQETWYRW